MVFIDRPVLDCACLSARGCMSWGFCVLDIVDIEWKLIDGTQRTSKSICCESNSSSALKALHGGSAGAAMTIVPAITSGIGTWSVGR